MTIKSTKGCKSTDQTLDGTLEVTITYLEMHRRPSGGQRSSLNEQIKILRAHQPTPSFYRYLYNHVGEPWLWYERRAMDNESLRVIIHDPAISIHVLYFDGVPAGYVELDNRVDHEIEIAYFGLLPEFIGRGLGPGLSTYTPL